MRTTQFSEFTFGFALTHNLINQLSVGGRVVPTFPSLKEEGKRHGGYDVEIPNYGAPLFLQFKLPQIVKRQSSKWAHGFSAPYYRMHLMRSTHSKQHASLLRHAQR